MQGAQAARPQATPLLEVRGCTMEFPGVKALDNVSFTLMPGECTRWSARTARANPRFPSASSAKTA